MGNHDVVVIGASAGGVQVLLDTVGQLPAQFPASLFVVVHQSPDFPSLLPELLSRRGPLPASHPLHDQRIAHGNIYVAPPDNHLLIHDGHMGVVRGARENGHRPAADALFRTAAAAYGSRVIGVVLSGYQNCGTAGMMSIKARGGLGVVQDPGSAQVPDMPRSVVDHVKVDYVVPPADMAGLLTRLVSTPAGPMSEPDKDIRQLEGREPGGPVELVCPICHGVLTEAAPGLFEHFRCHVGHTFSLESLAREQDEELERALWSATRSLEESSALNRRLSAREKGGLRSRLAEKGTTQAQQADLIKDILLHGYKAKP